MTLGSLLMNTSLSGFSLVMFYTFHTFTLSSVNLQSSLKWCPSDNGIPSFSWNTPWVLLKLLQVTFLLLFQAMPTDAPWLWCPFLWPVTKQRNISFALHFLPQLYFPSSPLDWLLISTPTKDTSIFISPPLCYIQFPVSKIFRLCCIISSNLCL